MRADLWQIADALRVKFSKVVLITSGRNFETDERILEEIRQRRGWLEIYLQFDSLDNRTLKILRGPKIDAALRTRRLQLAVSTGAAVTTVCVVPANVEECSIADLATHCRDQGAAGITFQPLRQLGRFPQTNSLNQRLATVDYVQNLALKGLNATANADPFDQQPFDISVAFLAGREVVSRQSFFQEKDHRSLFRVATFSYWDYNNYFQPLASHGRTYFRVNTEKSLNAHYFSPADRLRLRSMESSSLVS